MSENILTLHCVKTDKGCFISDASDKYYKENLKVLFFNGKHLVDTYCSDWYYVEEFPTCIQREKSGDIINARYELSDETLESEKMPKIIPYGEENNYSSSVIEALYEYKYDKAPPYLEDIEFNLKVAIH